MLRVDPRDATLVVTRAKAAEFEHLSSLCRKERPDVRVLYLAQGVSTRARWVLAVRLEA